MNASGPARRLSRHPEAAKARRWRARKVAERRGAVLVALLLEPGEVAALRRLGLLPGAGEGGPEAAPDPAALEAALRALLGAAERLSGPPAALAARDDA